MSNLERWEFTNAVKCFGSVDKNAWFIKKVSGINSRLKNPPGRNPSELRYIYNNQN